MQETNNMDNKEIWKVIPESEGKYEVSNLGNFKSVERIVKKWNGFRRVRERILKTGLTKDGYVQVRLFTRGKFRSLKAHRFIAEAFIPNPENKPCVNHINSIRTDNRIENLEWCTHSENLKHGYDYGYATAPQKDNFGLDHNSSIIVLDPTNGVYHSMKEASLVSGKSEYRLRRMLRGEIRNETNLIRV